MSRKLPTLIHQMRLRPRLLCSVLLGIAVGCALSKQLSVVTRSLVGWDAGVSLYLILALIVMGRSTLQHMRERAASQDEGALITLLFTLIAGVASLAAIVFEMSHVKIQTPTAQHWYFGLLVLTLVLSWSFVHTSFALHYAHEYYGPERHTVLQFPKSPEPDYWDFMYFSFVIGMTSQTADVDIQSRTMRRLALLHGVIAFFFNTTLLALAINAAVTAL